MAIRLYTKHWPTHIAVHLHALGHRKATDKAAQPCLQLFRLAATQQRHAAARQNESAPEYHSSVTACVKGRLPQAMSSL